MILKDHQQTVVRPRFVDAAENEVPAPGADVLTWRSSDESILTVTDNGDGTATVATTGTLGTASVTLSDDETGDGQPEFIGSLAVDVVTGPVTGIEVTADAPTERP